MDSGLPLRGNRNDGFVPLAPFFNTLLDQDSRFGLFPSKAILI
jgi:hypothetical protein